MAIELADLVITGIKRATASLARDYGEGSRADAESRRFRGSILCAKFCDMESLGAAGNASISLGLARGAWHKTNSPIRRGLGSNPLISTAKTLVPRGGIEPPTHGFSVRSSNRVNLL